MKQVVEEILSGKFNVDNGSLSFSCPRIELTVHADTVEEGSFTVYGPEGQETEGYVVSSDLRMECVTKGFTGSKDEILYRFDAGGMSAGEEIRGAFHIISNQGEYYLSFLAVIVSDVITSSLGSIKNLFHFTNLAKSNWAEAVRIFYSKEFRLVFTGSDKQHYAAYKGLSAVYGNERNMEEFLLEINKKKSVELIPEEKEIRLEDPLEDSRYALVVNRNGWGYTRFTVETEGLFLQVEERTVPEEAFLGNIYRLYYYIDIDKLHAGNNYGCIFLKQGEKTIQIPVTVVQHSANRKMRGLHRERRRLTVELMEYYQAFRLKKISSKTWMMETEGLLARMLEIDDKDVAVRLFQAQMLLTEERYNEAKWLIEKQENQALARRADAPALWCYYLYLTTLVSKDDTYIDEVAAVVEETYGRNRGNWRIAWLLMYLSDTYIKNPARKWRLLEELFDFSCTSPVIYIEAWHLLCLNPSMLMRLGDFELQVLFYAVRNDLMRDEVLLQLIYLAQKQKGFSAGLLKILEGCYERKPREDILHAICTLLIKGSCFGEKYFTWYQAGVEQNLRITRLYEYYMMSLPHGFEQPLPKMILMYFAYQSDLSYEQTAYLYAYVHRNREAMPDIYGSYQMAIERFVPEQIKHKRINADLAYLYQNIISPPMIDEESARELVSLLFMQELSVESEQIKEVILVYPYGAVQTVCPVISGKAQIPVYASDCKILLGDGEGNRYTVSEAYRKEPLMNPEKLARMVSPFVRDYIGYAVYTCYECANAFDVQDGNADLFVCLSQSDWMEEGVKQAVRIKLVQYYYERDRMRSLDDYLLALQPSDVAAGDRKEIVKYMVIREMYEEAFDWVCRFGPYSVDAKILMRLCSRMLDRDGTEENPKMTGILYYVLQKGKYDGNILQYLVRYFSGSIRDMRNVYRAADSFGVDTYELCERMLIQMLYTGAHIGEKTEIFRTYERGGGREELMAAFLSQCCYDYAVKEKITESYVMESVARLYRKGTPVHLVCRIAYLQYYVEHKKERTAEVLQVCKVFLEELLQERLVFPFYKEYQGLLPQMAEYADKTILEYRTKPDGKTMIHYVIQSEGEEKKEYCKAEMANMFAGICVKDFILFFGEKLQYYITEVEDGKEKLTQSGTVSKSDIGPEDGEGRFSILNDIMIGKTLQDYDTMDQLLHEYFRQGYMVEKLFQIR